MKKMMVVAVLVVAAVFCAQTVTFAASPWTTETTWSGKAGGKLIFGLKNLFFGWTQLLTVPSDYQKQGKSIYDGIGTGLIYAAADTIGGALHVVTFPITVDVPLPEDGVKIG